MIVSFANKETEHVWQREFSRRLPRQVQIVGYRKLVMIQRARDLNDLRIPPGNRLEALTGDRDGQYSIRINEQWRICFGWDDGRATKVEITDYH